MPRAVGAAVTLARLLARAHVSRYKRTLFFGECQLVDTRLLVPEQDRAESLERLYGDSLRQVLPGLTIHHEPHAGLLKKEAFTLR